MKYLEFGLLCIKTVFGSFMIAMAIWSIPYVLFEFHQTQERDRVVMSEAWHRINNQDDHEAWKFLAETGNPLGFSDWRTFCLSNNASHVSEEHDQDSFLLVCRSEKDLKFEREHPGSTSITAEFDVKLGVLTPKDETNDITLELANFWKEHK